MGPADRFVEGSIIKSTRGSGKEPEVRKGVAQDPELGEMGECWETHPTRTSSADTKAALDEAQANQMLRQQSMEAPRSSPPHTLK